MAELIEAGRIDPAYPKAPLLLGLMLLDARRIDEAIPALERAAALAPRDAQAQFSLGIALAASGRKVEALGRIEEALRIDPKDRRAAEAAARLRLDLGRR
jgi:tetratricopeptide (TPR) repeat protein